METKNNWLGVFMGAGFNSVECLTGIYKALEELNCIPDKVRASSGSALFTSLYYSGWTSKTFEVEENRTSPFDWVKLKPYETTKTLIGKSNYCLDNSYIRELLFKEMTFNATEHIDVSVTRLNDYTGHMKPATPDWTLAATSIPFVFPPVEKDGYLWGDGGVLNNVPLPSVEECKKYDRVLLFMAAETKCSYEDLGLSGIAELIMAVMCREEQEVKECGYLDLPNLTLIKPESTYGGNLFKWSDDFKCREACYQQTKEKLTEVLNA